MAATTPTPMNAPNAAATSTEPAQQGSSTMTPQCNTAMPGSADTMPARPAQADRH